MSGLPNSYFDYPWRRRGLDHDRFPHRNLPQARPVEWPGKARVAQNEERKAGKASARKRSRATPVRSRRTG